MKEKFHIVVDEKTGKFVAANDLFFRIYTYPTPNLGLAHHPAITNEIRRGAAARVKIDIKQIERWYVRTAILTHYAATELVANYMKHIRGDYLVKNGNVTRPALRIVKVIVHDDNLAKYIPTLWKRTYHRE